MPPKSKFTREEIINDALEIVKRDGIDALTARALGAELGCSARPIFTVFRGIGDVRSEVERAARALYTDYVNEGLGEAVAFRGVGKAYIRFAAEHPKLFMLLFMSENVRVPDSGSVLGIIDGNADKILASITDGYGLDEDTARKIYIRLWIYSHGIATLIATKVCAFTADEVSDMLTDVFVSLLGKYKKAGGEK